MAFPTKDTFLAQLACDECPICYEEVTGPTTTTCKHTFCLECLRHWMQSANTCPCCRTELYESMNHNQSASHSVPPAATPHNQNASRRVLPAPTPTRWIDLSIIPSLTLRTAECDIQSLITAVSERNAFLTTLHLWSICTQLRLPLNLVSEFEAEIRLVNEPTTYNAVESAAFQLQNFVRQFLHPRSYRGGSVSPHILKLFFTRMERRLAGLTS